MFIFMMAFFSCFGTQAVAGSEKITFPSKDQLTITAEWYPAGPDLPVILLCHQAGSSRGEYTEAAIKLNKFGFNCLAIDLRSGDKSQGIINETAAEAAKLGRPQSYLDAEQDIIAGIDYLYFNYKKKVIVVGSSYSASLALLIAKKNERVRAVAVFSPGEYFNDPGFVSGQIAGLSKPVFVTSSKAEADDVTALLKDVISMIKVQYIPKFEGNHGAKVLWESQPLHQEYWIALMSFLNRIRKLDEQDGK